MLVLSWKKKKIILNFNFHSVRVTNIKTIFLCFLLPTKTALSIRDFFHSIWLMSWYLRVILGVYLSTCRFIVVVFVFVNGNVQYNQKSTEAYEWIWETRRNIEWRTTFYWINTHTHTHIRPHLNFWHLSTKFSVKNQSNALFKCANNHTWDKTKIWSIDAAFRHSNWFTH